MKSTPETRQAPSEEEHGATSIGGTSPLGVGFELLVAAGSRLSTSRLEVGRTYVLGRGAECDIVVADQSVSRRHVRLAVMPDYVELVDLGSRNGTRVGGVALGSNPHRAEGTLLAEVGSVTLVVQRSRIASTPARAASLAGDARAVVADPNMLELYGMLDLVAPTSLSVLLLGETGAGKEVLARELHQRSSRATKPFLRLNCAALPESTLEAELFGYEKGAFTGAIGTKVGLFEAADGGTLFLDEVGDMPLTTQVKILRVLENGEVRRVGAVRSISVDVRVCAATNQDLTLAMAAGRFRSDLYFRLNGITFTIPALRERGAEILPLAQLFAERAAKRLNRPPPPFSLDAIAALEAYPWPGNVRELRNAVERAVVLSATTGGEIRSTHLPAQRRTTPPAPVQPPPSVAPSLSSLSHLAPPTEPFLVPPKPAAPRSLEDELRELERARIVNALTVTGGNQSRAARELGITRAVLLHRMRMFGLLPTRKGSDT